LKAGGTKESATGGSFCRSRRVFFDVVNDSDHSVFKRSGFGSREENASKQ
jgi:hypothetical protein